ncbi:XRE family transcriptional regulator [Paenibacillus sp. ACRRX]|uniref:helix-turn-helix domain-containing protein n=1 Tax=Paenibacillus sp. ACRRX TaxID=2918206 RepID=UPI001EF67CFE|nr:XRE family transcriptional regulator [Paenibacillus sp. ACRRX]MCG7410493.1 XRE family transcriptional regulator [Paenibacillus sp. ACRRX]
MDIDDPKQVVLQLGAIMKKYRKEKKLSLEELSELAGVSKLTLGNIERGETNPTLGMLWKISKGLSIPLMALFSTKSSVNISQAGVGLKIPGDQPTCVFEPIFQNTSDEMEMFRAYIQPNSSYQTEKHHPNTVEFTTVMTGAVSIKVNETLYTLNQYDSISFRADSTHSYINNANDVAVLHILLKYNL